EDVVAGEQFLRLPIRAVGHHGCLAGEIDDDSFVRVGEAFCGQQDAGPDELVVEASDRLEYLVEVEVGVELRTVLRTHDQHVLGHRPLLLFSRAAFRPSRIQVEREFDGSTRWTNFLEKRSPNAIAHSDPDRGALRRPTAAGRRPWVSLGTTPTRDGTVARGLFGAVGCVPGPRARSRSCMKIAILSGGTRGDVQPYVALGEFLAGRGHEVVLATHEPFRAMAEARGLEFVGLPGDPRQQIQTQEGRELVSSQRASLRFVRQLSELVEPWLEQLLEDVTPLCEKSDVVVYSPLAFLAWHVSQATGTPTVLAALQPYAPTREFPTVVLGGRNFGRSLNLASHYLADGLAWLSVGRTVNRLRTERLGLPPLGWRGSGPELRRQREPHLFGYSRHLVPKPAD